jgi:hypothetical protein
MYTIRLTANGKSYTRRLEVRPDPRILPGYAAKPYSGKGVSKEAKRHRR